MTSDETDTEDEPPKPFGALATFFGARIGRLEYWLWTAAILVAAMALAYAHALNLVLAITLKLGMMVQQNRRLHDFGRSGWWAILLVVLPYAVGHIFELAGPLSLANMIGTLSGLMLIAVIGCLRGDRTKNRFGEPPPRDLRGIIFK